MSDSETDVQFKVTGEFKKNVKKWLEIDDSIRELRSKTKDLTQDKKLYEDFILEFLEKNEESSVGISDGKLTRSVSQTKTALKKENIHKALLDITGDNNKAIEMTEYIIKSRGTTERVNLKRTRNRKN
jgi:hypothetical protein